MKEQQKTGLVSGQDIREEIARTKKNDWLRFNEMDPSISGRGAEPVYRDRIKGERISKEEFLKSRQKAKAKVEEKPKEVKLEWGKGYWNRSLSTVLVQLNVYPFSF
jgi:pre-mRNA-splicing factor CWC26